MTRVLPHQRTAPPTKTPRAWLVRSKAGPRVASGPLGDLSVMATPSIEARAVGLVKVSTRIDTRSRHRHGRVFRCALSRKRWSQRLLTTRVGAVHRVFNRQQPETRVQAPVSESRT